MLWQPSADKGKGNYCPMPGLSLDFHSNTHVTENIISRFSVYPTRSEEEHSSSDL